MNDPPDHTAELRAANLLSLGGMIVPNHRRTSSGYSRTAVSMSQNSTPWASRSSRLRWKTTSELWTTNPSATKLWCPRTSMSKTGSTPTDSMASTLTNPSISLVWAWKTVPLAVR